MRTKVAPDEMHRLERDATMAAEMSGSPLMTRVCRALAAVSTMLGVAAFSAGTAHADGPIQLKSRMGDFCLDAPSGSWFTPIVINPCNGTDFQRWNLTPDGQLESVAFPGNCLSEPGESWVSHLQGCLNWFTQKWTIQPNGQVTGDLSGCLTVLGGPDPGTWVSTRFCDGNIDQGWDSVP